MDYLKSLFISILCLFCTISAYSQVTVTVNGAAGEDFDSRPGEDTGLPEDDRIYETLGAAVSDLEQHFNGGKIILDSPSKIDPFLYDSIHSNIQIVGITGRNRLDSNGIIGIEGGEIDIDNVILDESRIYVYANSKVKLENCFLTGLVDNQGGIRIKDNNTHIEVNNTIFEKCRLAVEVAEFSADTVIHNSTFTNCTSHAIVDKHSQGTSEFDSLFIQGGGTGIQISSGAKTATNILSSTIVNMNTNGIELVAAANVKISNCNIQNASNQGVYFDQVSDATLEHCKISQCGDNLQNLPFALPTAGGIGGKRIENFLSIKNCTVSNNPGSGIHFQFSNQIVIQDCIVNSNKKSGIRIEDVTSAQLINDVARENITGPNNLHGGGICLLRVHNSLIEKATIELNTASVGHGGGVYASETNATFIDNQIMQNKSQNNGGGCALENQCESSFESNTFRENQAGLNGGGLFNNGGIIQIKSSIFTQNHCDNNGGGICLIDMHTARTDIIDSQYISNTSFQNGGGIYVGGQSSNGIVIGSKTNNLIKQNKAKRNGGGICFENVESSNVGVFISAGDKKTASPLNFIGNEAEGGSGGGVFINKCKSIDLDGGNNFYKNKANGDSPLMDKSIARAGNGGGLAVENSTDIIIGNSTFGNDDQNQGNGNIAKNNGGGFYVYRSTIFFGGGATGVGGPVCGNEAMLGNGGGIAIVESSEAPLVNNQLGLVSITLHVIKQNKATAPIPQGIQAYQSHVGNGGGISITVNSSNVVLDGGRNFQLIIGSDLRGGKNINLDEGNQASANGGGIFVESSNPVIKNAFIFANISKNGCGGGIAFMGKVPFDLLIPDYPNAILKDSIIQANKAIAVRPAVPDTLRTDSLVGNGGGIACLLNANDVIIAGCLIGPATDEKEDIQPIKGNMAENNGGGIYTFSSLPTLSASISTKTTALVVHHNNAKGSGGGVAIRDESKDAVLPLIIKGTIITKNSAEESGGGVAILDEANDANVEEANIESNIAQKDGGGIYIRRSNPDLGNSQNSLNFFLHDTKLAIQQNHSINGDGGGIAIENDSEDDESFLEIQGAVIKNNIAENGNGGGLAFLNGSHNVKLEYCLIGIDENGNKAGNEAMKGAGGGIYINNSLPFIGGERIPLPPLGRFPRMSVNTISFNSARNGGGIGLSNALAGRILGNDITKNRALNMGGGVYCSAASSMIGPVNPPPLPFSDFLQGGNFISENSAQIGGGIALTDRATPQIRWNVINNNTVTGGAGATGGIYTTGEGTNPEITNCDILSNEDDGIRSINGSKPLIQNNIIDSNGGYGLTASLLDVLKNGGDFAGNCLHKNGKGAFGPDTKNMLMPFSQEKANFGQDPVFLNRPLQDYRLTENSPCSPGNSPPGTKLIGAWPGPIVQMPTQELAINAQYHDADFGDINGDGLIDLAVSTTGKDFILLNSGLNNFEESILIQITPDAVDHSRAIELGDIDGDGDLDVVIADAVKDILAINSGDEFIDASDSLASSGSSNNVKMADMNNSGALDILFAKTTENVLYIGDGKGNFTLASSNLGNESRNTNDIGIGDLDADGDLDLYIANTGQDSVLLNDGNGFFTAGPTPPYALESECVTLGDVDEDGDLDVFVAGSIEKALLINQGNATFTDFSTNLPQFQTEIIDADFADLNNDGKLDILIALSHERAVFINNGELSFSEDISKSTSSEMYVQSDAADIDGDGILNSVYVHETGLQFVDYYYLSQTHEFPVIFTAPYQVPSSGLISLTKTGYFPSIRNSDIRIDDRNIKNFLVNISQLSAKIPDGFRNGEYVMELFKNNKRTDSTTIRVGDLIVNVDQWWKY
ncbi:MAG: hypothetical protein GC154_07400 [bacterium]|nr:hypothetical protein [bacterium]